MTSRRPTESVTPGSPIEWASLGGEAQIRIIANVQFLAV